MDCTDYRRALLADPHHPSAQMLAHVAQCHDCPEYTQRLLGFESRLDRALRVDSLGAPSSAEGVVVPIGALRQREDGRLRVRRRGFAIAASILLGAMVAGGLWIAAPGSSLAADVVNHMAEEPGAWARTDVAVPQPKLDQVLLESHVELKAGAALVSYASSCPFRGHVVPHLVVQTAGGPVTVMVLAHESVKGSLRFDEHGYRGVIVPVPDHGSLAVLERGPDTDMKVVEGVAAQVLGAIEWTR